MGQEIELKDAGLVGINVTNPPAVGGTGLSIALDGLEGKTVPRVTHLTPKVYDGSTPDGQAWLKSLYDPKVDPNFPVYSPPSHTRITPSSRKKPLKARENE